MKKITTFLYLLLAVLSFGEQPYKYVKPLPDGGSITLLDDPENKEVSYLVDQTKEGKKTKFWSGPRCGLVSCDIKGNDISVLLQMHPIYLHFQLVQFNRETKATSEIFIPCSFRLRRVREWAKEFRVVAPNQIFLKDIVGKAAVFTIQKDGKLLNGDGVEVFPAPKTLEEHFSHMSQPHSSELSELELGHGATAGANAISGANATTPEVKVVREPSTTEKKAP
jgi:hypothetical protein